MANGAEIREPGPANPVFMVSTIVPRRKLTVYVTTTSDDTRDGLA